jgi:hypothetical protein
MVDCRGGLATFIGAAACSFTGLIKGIFEAGKIATNPVFIVATEAFCGKIIP